MILYGILSILLIIPAITAFANLFFAPRLRKKSGRLSISVLIPARNEEKRIGPLLDSLSKQTLKPKEVIVLDDSSDDGTYSLCKNHQAVTRVIKGKPLPKNWVGKNWACEQLGKAAKEEFLLFLDSDIELEKDALARIAHAKTQYRADVLSVFPKQETKTLGELLTVPTAHTILLAYLFLPFIYLTRRPTMSAAVGQVLGFTKDAYALMGGHKAVRSSLVEDLQIARTSKKKGLRLVTFVSEKAIRCRMYTSFGEAIQGFSKNYYEAAQMSTAGFFAFVLHQALLLVSPLALFLPGLEWKILGGAVLLAHLAIALTAKDSIASAILSPLRAPISVYLAIRSYTKTTYGERTWAGRVYQKHNKQ